MTTTYFRNLVAGNVFGTKTSPGLPASYYIGLSSTTPQEDGSGVTEPDSSGGYHRIPFAHMSEPADGKIQNTAIVEFPKSSDPWGTVSHYVLFDAESGGNSLLYDKLSKPRNIDADSVMIFETGALCFSVVDVPASETQA